MLSLATKFVPDRSSFQTASDAGFRAAEFWLDPKLLLETDRISTTASDFPFRYAMHFPNHGPINPEMLANTASLYKKLNCTAIIIHQPMFDRYAASLQALAPELDLAIENHILDAAEFEEWADKSPGLTLDVEHLWKFTLNDGPLNMLLERLDRFLDRYVSKLQHVHLLGYHPGGEEHRPVHHNTKLTTEVLTRLAAHGFGKLVVSEADLPHQTLESLEQDVTLFEEWKKTAAGFSQ